MMMPHTRVRLNAAATNTHSHTVYTRRAWMAALSPVAVTRSVAVPVAVPSAVGPPPRHQDTMTAAEPVRPPTQSSTPKRFARRNSPMPWAV